MNLFYFQCLKIDFRFFLFLAALSVGSFFDFVCCFFWRGKVARGGLSMFVISSILFGNSNVNECVDCVSVLRVFLRICYRISFFPVVVVLSSSASTLFLAFV